MERILSQATSNRYTDACTIEGVWGGPGGFFTIDGADVFMQIQYGRFAIDEGWTDEVHVPSGTGTLLPGTAGVRFRSYVANVPATVSAGLSSKVEPAISIGSGGQNPSVTTKTGTQRLTWAGGSSNTGVVAVPHGLSSPPSYVGLTITSVNGLTATQLPILETGVFTATTFNAAGATADGTSPGGGAYVDVCWFAVV